MSRFERDLRLRGRSEEELVGSFTVDWGEFGVRLAAVRLLVREFDSPDVDSSF